MGDKNANNGPRERLIAQVRAARGNLRNVTGAWFFLDDLAAVLGFDSLADLLGRAPAYQRPERRLDSDKRVTVSIPPPLELFEADTDSEPCRHKRVEMSATCVTCLDCGDVVTERG